MTHNWWSSGASACAILGTNDIKDQKTSRQGALSLSLSLSLSTTSGDASASFNFSGVEAEAFAAFAAGDAADVAARFGIAKIARALRARANHESTADVLMPKWHDDVSNIIDPAKVS